MQYKTEERSRAIILRTCELVSPKFFFRVRDPESSKAVKATFFDNLLEYADLNDYNVFVICDSINADYRAFVAERFLNRGEVEYVSYGSNAASFHHMVQTALRLDYKWYEFAEDDFLKAGMVPFHSLEAGAVYTFYDHPDRHFLHKRAISFLVNSEISTVCSFLIEGSTIQKCSHIFMKYGYFSDSAMWRELTLPQPLRLMWSLKNSEGFRASFPWIGRSIRLRFVRCDAQWIHCASDSLPRGFSRLKEVSCPTDMVSRFKDLLQST